MFGLSQSEIEKLLVQNEAEQFYGAFWQYSLHNIYKTNGPRTRIRICSRISPIFYRASFFLSAIDSRTSHWVPTCALARGDDRWHDLATWDRSLDDRAVTDEVLPEVKNDNHRKIMGKHIGNYWKHDGNLCAIFTVNLWQRYG